MSNGVCFSEKVNGLELKKYLEDADFSPVTMLVYYRKYANKCHAGAAQNGWELIIGDIGHLSGQPTILLSDFTVSDEPRNMKLAQTWRMFLARQFGDSYIKAFEAYREKELLKMQKQGSTVGYQYLRECTNQEIENMRNQLTQSM